MSERPPVSFMSSTRDWWNDRTLVPVRDFFSVPKKSLCTACSSSGRGLRDTQQCHQGIFPLYKNVGSSFGVFLLYVRLINMPLLQCFMQRIHLMQCKMNTCLRTHAHTHAQSFFVLLNKCDSCQCDYLLSGELSL